MSSVAFSISDVKQHANALPDSDAAVAMIVLGREVQPVMLHRQRGWASDEPGDDCCYQQQAAEATLRHVPFVHRRH